MTLGIQPLPPRVLGDLHGGEPGPLLVVLGGIHGNEPDGVLALQRVIDVLEKGRGLRRGRLVALSGNRHALGFGERYVDRDLNRMWFEANLREPSGAGSPHEQLEARQIHEHLEELLEEHDGEVCLVDLHSTSAQGAPFVIVADTLQNRRLALAFDVPVLLGLEERVEGTLLSWFSERGHVALCLEGGQNSRPSTVDNHEAALWVAFETLGLVDRQDLPDPGLPERLRSSARGLPRVIEVIHREGIDPDEAFNMAPGHLNFDRVERGRRLAEKRRLDWVQTVRAPFSGFLLMPHYQGQGNDGFFLGREVRPFWLKLSSWLRRRGLSGFLRLLPGVRVDPERPNVLLANPHIARWHLVDLFHLFGYRRAQPADGREVFVRRPDRFDRS